MKCKIHTLNLEEPSVSHDIYENLAAICSYNRPMQHRCQRLNRCTAHICHWPVWSYESSWRAHPYCLVLCIAIHNHFHNLLIPIINVYCTRQGHCLFLFPENTICFILSLVSLSGGTFWLSSLCLISHLGLGKFSKLR